MPTESERAWLTVDEFKSATKLGRTLIYEAIRRGELPSVRIGRRILIPADALDQLLKQNRNTAN